MQFNINIILQYFLQICSIGYFAKIKGRKFRYCQLKNYFSFKIDMILFVKFALYFKYTINLENKLN